MESTLICALLRGWCPITAEAADRWSGPDAADMETQATSSSNEVLDEIVTALRRGDVERAEKALASAAHPSDAQAMLRLAELNVRRRRWHDAAWFFDRVPDRDAASELKRCLCRNLACLERHRPALYQRLVQQPVDDKCSVGMSGTNRPTIIYRRQDKSQVSLSPGDDPLAGMAAAMRSVRPYLDKGQPLALTGVGDGYLLNALARDATPLFLDMRQPVFVLEPEPQVLLHCLMIHDCTGPQGPIEQERFFWFVGPGWERELEAAVAADPFLGCPVVSVPLGMHSPSMREGMQRIIQSILQADIEAAGRVAAFHAEVDAADVAALFGPNPPRKPRVLLLTTRFSSVLQYSTRDTAAGFRQIGWETHVVIEPTPAHRIFRPAIRRALDEFKPDLVFQIDHLRYEHGDMFPPDLPFACWAQDHLPNLTSEAAGAAVGPRDFVLVGMPTMYTGRWNYPKRQCVALTKLTHPPARPTSWESDGEDLVYVSTTSQLPVDVRREILARYVKSPEAYSFAAECCRRMIDLYARGDSLPTHYSVRLFVEQIEQDLGIAIEVPGLRQELIDVLFDRLGNLLYRHQSLTWAAGIAGKHSLKLGIYGPGWDKHPDFAAFARGRVTYGPDLEALTRKSRINLCLEPFFCKSHQRLLDGLAAGGFFLVRDNPFNRVMPELSHFVSRHASPDAATVGAVLEQLAPEFRAGFENLLARCACMTEFGDPVEFVRNGQQAGTLDDTDEAMPFLSRVSFADAAEMEQRVLEYVGDAERRREIALAQCRSIEQRRSYAAGLERIVSAIGALLSEEAAAAQREIVQREAA
jgi:hypothetical protein